ncbi:ABC transporter substrate-binding protein [Microbacterium sp. 18062]|uniref:ABC transporter substrate-binding protein n=1 Tax=Microbacterium sp. 18062 TaxID=2681410 RepID=UPI001356F9A8|nr:ABC transporter substrate-binding protein [Microbacterium sp. 18062]
MLTRHRIRPAAALAATAAAALLLASCSGGASTTADASSEPVSGGELNIEFFPDNPAFSCVDPFQVYWIEHRQVIRNYADSLTDQDPETGEIVPWLATDWTISDDGLAYTFDLRDDVTFSDGTEFTADSVVLALDNAKKTAAEVPGAYGSVYILGYDHSAAVDDDTVEVHFSTPNAAFLQGTSTSNLAILAASSYSATPEERCLGTANVGSGPFVLDSYTPGEGIDLSKREGYAWASELNAHQGDAYLDAVHISYVAEDSVRVGDLTSGASDIDWPRNPLTPEQVAQVEAAGATVESRSLPGPAYNLYANTSDGRVLADEDVRKAVLVAIDRATYASTIYGADYPVVGGVFDETTPFFLDLSDQLAYDPDEAAALLDAAGWVLEDGATYRTKDGETLTIVQPITADNPGDALLQDQLKQVGIDLRLPVFQASERGALITGGDYDLLGSYLTRGDPSVLGSILDTNVATSTAFAQNAVPDDLRTAVESLFAAGLAATDSAEREEAYTEVQQLLVDSALVFPIFERVQLAAVAADVHGFRFTSEAFLSYYDIWKSGE